MPCQACASFTDNRASGAYSLRCLHCCARLIASARPLRRLIDEFGPRTISAIRPHEVAQLLRRLHGQYPHLARRVLIEARDCFGEAVAYGWINTNPAASVRHQPTKVARRRLTLDEWQRIYAWSQANQPSWASA